MSRANDSAFVSRGGEKLAAALDHFSLNPTGLTCADLGSHVGGFVDCLLSRGAAKVYSVDTSYGTLAWTLRKDDRVVVIERQNAMHVELPEPVDLVTIDVGWTPQRYILPHVATILHATGCVVSLIKPHYEAPKDALTGGVLSEDAIDGVMAAVRSTILKLGWIINDTVESPIRGHGGNREWLMLLRKASCRTPQPSQ